MRKFTGYKVYKLFNDNDDKYYIGSTRQQLSRRIANHRIDGRKLRYNSNMLNHFNEIGWDNVKIILVERISDDSTKEDLVKKENEYINRKDDNCLNMIKSIRTKEERLEYYRTHKSTYCKLCKKLYRKTHNCI